jgi:hypothetical protein
MLRVTKAALRRSLERLLHTHDTPTRTAAAYALGVFWGFSPPLGLHTVLALVCAFALNLNRVAVLLGVYSNLPWTVAPYYIFATLGGAALLGADAPPGLLAELRRLLEDFSAHDIGEIARMFAPLLWSYVVGSTIGATLLALLAYRVSLVFITAHRRHLAKIQAEHPPHSPHPPHDPH